MLRCPSCGEESSDRARFCQRCGSALPELQPAHDERKLVSILFVDLVGFTSRSDQADPEDVREVLKIYQSSVRGCITEFGGTVEKFIGDAVMAVFGAPLSHGDDAERAVRAGLRILQTIEKLNEEMTGLDLAVHAAVNTGEAIVKVGTRADAGEAIATGDVINVAARLQTAAPAQSLIVGVETYRATRHAIRYSELPALDVKGKREPVRVWRAQDVLTAPGERVATQTPFVGRTAELGVLQEICDEVKQERRPYLVTLIGPPGVGKSRLVRELARRNAGSGAQLLRGRCQPYAERGVYAAFGQQVRQIAGIFDDDPPAAAREKLELVVSNYLAGHEGDELGRYLPLLVGIGPGSQDERLENRLPLFYAARRLIESIGRRQFTVMIFEDIHWAAVSELDLIEYLAWHLKDTPVLLITLTRPELFDSRASWSAGLSTHKSLPLEPLSGEDAVALARQLLPGADQAESVAKVGEGNPLFIEELAAAVADREQPGELPASVKEAIAANIDTLPTSLRSVLLDASVIGRIFWAGILTSSSSAQSLSSALEQLTARGLIRREQSSQISGDAQFAFKHALIQDVAYGTLSRSARRAQHGRVARALEERLGAATSEMASLLGHHWREAGEPTRAVSYLLVAADRALKAWAKDDATRLYEEALALLPETDIQQRARVRLMHGRALVDLGEFAAGADELDAVIKDLEGRDLLEGLLARAHAAFWLEETAQVLALGETATELADEIGNQELLGPALSMVAIATSTRGDDGDLDRAIQIGERALNVWVPGSRPIDLAVHKNFHAVTHYWAGNYDAALKLAESSHAMGGDYDSIEALFRGGGEQALALVAVGRHAEAILLVQSLLARAMQIGRRWGSFARSIWSLALRDLNQPAEARLLNEEALDLANSVGSQFAGTQQMLDILSIDLDQGEIGKAQAEVAALRERIAGMKDWSRWVAQLRLAEAHARFALASGDTDDATERAQAAMALARRKQRPKYEALAGITLGSALLKADKPEDAVSALRSTVEIADRLGTPPIRWQAWATLGRAQYAAGSDDAARDAFHEAAAVIRAFSRTLQPEHSATLMAASMVREVLKGQPEAAV